MTRTHARMWYGVVLAAVMLVVLLDGVAGLVADSNDDLVVAMVADTENKYAVQDHYILDGINFFINWTNQHGGFKYANYTRKVRVITRDAATSPSNTNALVSAGYRQMINESTMIMSPISTPRTTAAANVSESNKQINFAVGASADSLFRANYSYFFSTVVTTSNIPQYTLAQFVGKAQNYVLFSTNDAVSISVTSSVMAYMNRSGIPLLFSYQVIIDSTQNSGLEGQLNKIFSDLLVNLTSDLFVCTFPPDDFSILVSSFERAQPKMGGAAFVLPLTRTVQRTTKSGNTGDFWVGATQFDPSTNYGISDQFGGTATEFNEQFVSYFGHDPDPYAATAAAALMSYYYAVQAAGTVNSDVVKKELVDMPTFHCFLGDINFAPNGTSIHADYLTFQFLGGLGEFINSSHSLVYPAPWPWNPTPPPTPTPTPPNPIIHHSKPLSIVLGVITGICICVALVALVFLVVKKDLFRKQGIVYCTLILIGVLCTYVAALTTLPEPTDRLCVAFPWLLGVGFTLVFGCLFIKTWVLLQIFRSAATLQKLQSLTLTAAYIARLIISAVLVEVVFLIIWTVVDPPKAELRDTLVHDRQLMCTRSHPVFWALFIAYKGIWLLGGVVVSVMTRNIRADYNESKNIVLSIYNCSVVTIIAVILAYILPTIPAAITLIQVVAILVAFTFSLVVLFSTPFTNLVNGTEMDFRSGASTTSAGSMRTDGPTSGRGHTSGSSNTNSA